MRFAIIIRRIALVFVTFLAMQFMNALASLEQFGVEGQFRTPGRFAGIVIGYEFLVFFRKVLYSLAHNGGFTLVRPGRILDVHARPVFFPTGSHGDGCRHVQLTRYDRQLTRYVIGI